MKLKELINSLKILEKQVGDIDIYTNKDSIFTTSYLDIQACQTKVIYNCRKTELGIAIGEQLIKPRACYLQVQEAGAFTQIFIESKQNLKTL